MPSMHISSACEHPLVRITSYRAAMSELSRWLPVHLLQVSVHNYLVTSSQRPLFVRLTHLKDKNKQHLRDGTRSTLPNEGA